MILGVVVSEDYRDKYWNIRFESGRWVGTNKESRTNEALPDKALKVVDLEDALDLKGMIATAIENATGVPYEDSFPLEDDE